MYRRKGVIGENSEGKKEVKKTGVMENKKNERQKNARK